MLDPQRPVSDYLDDFVHGLLDEQDAARVQTWLDQNTEGNALLEAAERRRRALAQLAPVEASERLIRSTLEAIEMKATRPRTALRIAARSFLALAAAALVIISACHTYYYRFAPSPYNVRLLGQSRLLSGSDAVLRLAVFNEEDGVQVLQTPMEISLVSLQTQKVEPLGTFHTSLNAEPRVKLPDWPAGDCLLRIAVDLPTGREVLEERVTLTRSFKLMLSTDKPLYQPGQIIHLRSLALRRPDLKPIVAEPVLFEVLDSKGNIIFKQRDTTSEYGLASADCQLASEINTGEYRLRCKIGDTTSERTVKVDRYVLPKFKLAIELDKPFYAPGDKVGGKLSAKYFFGQPVKGTVKLQARSTDVSSVVFHEKELETDAEGSATFDFALPAQLIGTPQNGGKASFQLFATVTDSAGQAFSTMVSRLVTRDVIDFEIIPEGGAFVRGLPNRVFIHASFIDGKPAVMTIKVNDLPQVTTNELGVAVIEVTPLDSQFELKVAEYEDPNSPVDRVWPIATKTQRFQCGASAADFVLRADKSVYRGGDTMKLTALGGGVEPVFIDLIKDGQTLLSQTLAVQSGRGELEIDLSPEMFGSMELVAYRFDASGISVRKSRLIFVQQARELSIATRLDQDEYRPGAQAKIKFTLTDADGKQTPGAISLSAVDEAVYSVLNQRPGLEQAFFLAEQQLLQPVYTIYPDWSPAQRHSTPDRELLEDAVFALTAYTAQGDIQLKSGYRNNTDLIPAAVSQPAAGSESTSTPTANPVFARSPITLVANTYPAKVTEAAQVRQQGLRGVAVAWFFFFSSLFVFGVVVFAVLQPKAFMITTGVLCLLAMCGGPLVVGGLYFTSTQVYETNAKAEAAWPGAVESAAPLSEMPLDSAAPPAETPAAPPRVRQHFPETLLWQPELVTNEAGEAELSIDLADSITTWRISASAVSAAGQLGDAQVPLKVFQPFFVDLNLPVALTRNDEVSVPVVVYNYLDKPQTVELKLDSGEWFQLLGEDADKAASQTLELKPGEVRSLHYRLKVLTVGYQQLKVTATGGGVADAIERSIEVVPNGRLVETVHSNSLDTPGKAADMSVTIPDNAVPGSVKAFVKFHPGGFSQLVEGLDAIFRMPSGCFEQTSSTTYPNVLALDYLRSTKKSIPEVEAKARQYIHAGYQRLISFEVPGGGFDWFGNPPANRTLTAYGLQEFVDMAKVHDVDPALIARTRQWLLAQRQADGSWEPEPHMLNDGLAGSVNRGDDARLVATAYIAWSVFHSSPRADRSQQDHQQFEVTANFLRARRPESISDPYVLATLAMALAAYDPKLPELQQYLARLDELKKSDDKSCWWEQPEDAARPFYGSGQAGQVETTAMAALAMLTAKSHGDTAAKALHWLVIHKDPHGTWHSTQATVLALRALLLGTNAASEAKERQFEIKINDLLVQKLTVEADQSDVVKQLDLSPWLTRIGDPNQVSFTEITDTSTSFQAVFRHHVDAPAEPTTPEALAIEIVYDRARLNVDEMVTATATIVNNLDTAAPMVILDLPIPGGFTIERGELDELVGSRKIEKYQLTARQAIVYLRGLEAKHQLQLQYRLKATMPVKVTVPRGEAYEYYNPAKRGSSQPFQLEATIKT